MKKWVMVLVVTGLLSACNDSTDNRSERSVQDTLQEAVVDTELAKVQQSFPQLFQYLKKQDSTFSEDSFLLSGENTVEEVPPAPVDEKQFQPFQKYLIYNSDSSLAIDLYSYNYIVAERNGTSRLEEGGPDSEAAVIDMKTKTRRRVFFGGPSYTLWDAKWTGPKELLLIGAETGEEGKVIPTIWHISLRNTSIQVYAYEGEVRADGTGYTKAKLGMGF